MVAAASEVRPRRSFDRALWWQRRSVSQQSTAPVSMPCTPFMHATDRRRPTGAITVDV
jgi:hypothetical protein